MTIQIPDILYSVEDYHKMGEVGIIKPTDRVELINGKIIPMSPIGSRHGSYIDRANQLLTLLLVKNAIIRVQSPIAVNNNSEPEPDIAILKPRKDFYLDAHPQPNEVYLIIEVAISSLEYDQQIKAPLYAASAIPEYWIMNIDEATLEIYRQPRGGRYKSKIILEEGEIATIQTLKIDVAVNDLFGF